LPPAGATEVQVLPENRYNGVTAKGSSKYGLDDFKTTSIIIVVIINALVKCFHSQGSIRQELSASRHRLLLSSQVFVELSLPCGV
jgi:hypothetical protein